MCIRDRLLDGIMVDYYGTPTPINQVGNIAAPEPRLLTISLWDASILHEVEKAIQASDLGINPANDGKVIRLAFPEITGEKRQEQMCIRDRFKAFGQALRMAAAVDPQIKGVFSTKGVL